jgi:DNA-binding Lrp family transcriptional regulator
MTEYSSVGGVRRGAASNDVRPALDDVDRQILDLLATHGRLPNNALAERVGIAPSTCLGRTRALVERGVIRGFYADVDPAAVGRPIQAVISVRLQAHARAGIAEFAHRVAELPQVRNVFFLAGAHDFLIHVAAASTEELRNIVAVSLSGSPEVAATETNLVFEHVRAPGI